MKNYKTIFVALTLTMLSVVFYVSAEMDVALQSNVTAKPSTLSNPPVDKLNLSEISRNIDNLKLGLDKTQKIAENALLYLGIMFTVILAFAVAVYQYATRRYKTKIVELEASLVRAATERMNDQFEEVANKKVAELDHKSTTLFNKIEEKHFKYMQITSLKVSGNYDEALEQAGWRGDYTPFKNEPDAYQRILIYCLAKSQNAQKDVSHLSAWQWTRVLLEKNPNYRNMEAMLRTGIGLKHFDEAVTEYDKYSNKLSPPERDKCEPFLFVAIRRARKPANYEEYTIRLRDLASKHRDTSDIKVTTNFAAFYRDNGQLEDAERLMEYNVQRIVNGSPMEDGWEKLFNTYIANCVDQGMPEKAIKQSRMLISSSCGPDNVFTCARLAWHLDDQTEEKKVLLDAISKVIANGHLPENADGTIKSRALLLAAQGKYDEAQFVLESAINKVMSRNDKWSENNLYFFKSLLAQILLARKDAASVERAIELIGRDVTNDTIGEVQYLMAKVCALRGNEEGVRRYLENAAKIKRKWIMIASHDKELSKLLLVSQLLMQHA